jgi:hypothetical protein
MITNETTPPREDYLGQIWSISTTLTEQAMTAALAKAAMVSLLCVTMPDDPVNRIDEDIELFIGYRLGIA